MASIYQRKDTGTWYVSYYYNGRHIREKVGKNKQAAKYRLHEVELQIVQDKIPSRSDVPIAELVKDYLNDVDARTVSESWRRRLGNVANNFLSYCKRQRLTLIEQIDYRILDRYITDHVTVDGVAPQTSNMEIDFLRNLFGLAVKYRYLN